jgi:predicted PurR-regulated permease PerM
MGRSRSNFPVEVNRQEARGRYRMRTVVLLIVMFFSFIGYAYSMAPAGEKLLFQTLGEIKGELKQINKRIDEVNRRIDDVNKRIDDITVQLSKRIDDTNSKIDDLRSDMNARFEQHFKYMGWTVAGMFILTGTFAGLLIWDRRTMIKEAKRQVYDDMEREFKPEKFRKVLSALRELAKNDKKVEEILRREGLL